MRSKSIFGLFLAVVAVFSLGACALAPTQNRGDTVKTIDEAWSDISAKVQKLAAETGSEWKIRYNPIAEVCDGDKSSSQVSFGVDASLTASVDETREILASHLESAGFEETHHRQYGDASDHDYTVSAIFTAENYSSVDLMVGKVGGIMVRAQSACVPETADLRWEPNTELSFTEK